MLLFEIDYEHIDNSFGRQEEKFFFLSLCFFIAAIDSI